MDLEINPQIRTDRSQGVYSTFRFVDSNHSSGKIRVGYFKDKSSYTQEHGLTDDEHYGIEFNYESSKVFEKYLPDGFDDGLYVNTTYLNDIDYLYLQRTTLDHFGFSPIQQSRINYFAQESIWIILSQRILPIV
jgi:LPS-assembly protein